MRRTESWAADGSCNTMNSKDEKLLKLQAVLRSFGKVLIGFSGGVDSVFLTAVAVDILGKDNVVAVIGESESVPQRQVQEAEKLANQMGIRVERLSTEELQ